jgi:hypothetical protein
MLSQANRRKSTSSFSEIGIVQVSIYKCLFDIVLSNALQKKKRGRNCSYYGIISVVIIQLRYNWFLCMPVFLYILDLFSPVTCGYSSSHPSMYSVCK